jgi:hypothetical protein
MFSGLWQYLSNRLKINIGAYKIKTQRVVVQTEIIFHWL